MRGIRELAAVTRTVEAVTICLRAAAIGTERFLLVGVASLFRTRSRRLDAKPKAIEPPLIRVDNYQRRTKINGTLSTNIPHPCGRRNV